VNFVDVITIVFFLASLVIFLAKIANIMTYKFVPGQRALKYYGKDIALVSFIVPCLTWLFIFAGYSVSATEINFLTSYGLPYTSILEQTVMLALMNIILILTGIFTFAEIILLGWSDMRGEMERQRRGFYESGNNRRRVSPRNPYIRQ
jgi:hypothetical protein